MQSRYFSFFLLIIFFFFNSNKSFSEDEFPSLDLNKDQNKIVQNALTSCKDVNFENLLNSRKEKLGVSEPDKTINKKKQLDNSLGIEVSRSIETIYTPKQSLDNVNKILSSIKDLNSKQFPLGSCINIVICSPVVPLNLMLGGMRKLILFISLSLNIFQSDGMRIIPKCLTGT